MDSPALCIGAARLTGFTESSSLLPKLLAATGQIRATKVDVLQANDRTLAALLELLAQFLAFPSSSFRRSLRITCRLRTG